MSDNSNSCQVLADLPSGWLRRPLAAVSELVRGVTYKRSQAVDHPADGFVPLVRATNIEVDHLLLNEFVYVPASVVREDQYLQSGDIVLAVSSGSSSVVGKSAMVREIGATTFGAFCGVLRPSTELLADFLRFVVQSPGIREMWSEAARGTNINNLKRDQIISTEIVIPPLEEQRVIVGVLEGQFSFLDAALESVRRSRVEAVRLRRALLRDAFSGVLTHPGLRQGDLPSGWRHASLASFVSHRSGNSKIIKGKQSSAPMPGLFQGFSASGPDVWVEAAEYDGAGVVVSAVGARCGKTFIAGGRWTAIANTHVVVPKSEIDVRFLWYLTNREEWWVKSGTAQPFVKVKDTLERSMPIPPLEEQRVIVELLERELGLLDLAMKAADRIEIQAKSLRRSLLHSAFNGELTREWRDS